MSAFWAKAQDAAQSAKLQLDAGYVDGAVNRAYYAMLHAARSTLERIDPGAAAAKKHSTVIGQFARQVVRVRGMDPSLGRLFNLAFNLRLIADYEPERVAADVALEIVADMDRFLTALAPMNQALP